MSDESKPAETTVEQMIDALSRAAFTPCPPPTQDQED